ncbi:SPL family radical SAM protein [Butyrivibrio sp. MC2013]|uniref:SPL family radical SAM protein n=1 Tax=Butyrivibrio sp. MC2013 TaxID=1280686 RepID=UPI0004094F83|nr:DNA repair photolyase [Butyrivibrio sp. MC2013]
MDVNDNRAAFESSDIVLPAFHHIYVEKELLRSPEAERIIKRFPAAGVIEIDHYKDIFNRKRQDGSVQRKARSLILAQKSGRLVYDGAPVCQNFGNKHFYYTSVMMNCIYDCEYCYLKGMYPSGNMVLFINLDDIFAAVEELLGSFPVYLSVSYDTDLMAVEDITGYIARWIDFTLMHEDLTIEIRTKCARRDLWDRLPACDRVIFAYTLSPDEIAGDYEHGCQGLRERLKASSEGLDKGYSVRLCFDPMIYIPGWKKAYADMIEEAASLVDFDRVRDFSVGSFRISEEYLKRMRRSLPYSAVVQYPFELSDGYYHYPQALTDEMEGYLKERILEHCQGAQIFRWKES